MSNDEYIMQLSLIFHNALSHKNSIKHSHPQNFRLLHDAMHDKIKNKIGQIYVSGYSVWCRSGAL